MRSAWIRSGLLGLLVVASGCGRAAAPAAMVRAELPETAEAVTPREGVALATLGGGCFWCTEAIFKRVEGVRSVVSGFAGGQVENPSYRQVMEGRTGHAEVVQVEFDQAVISYDALLGIFFSIHDPTTLDRQGPDVGPMYRSIILAHDDFQKSRAEYFKAQLGRVGAYDDPIVTEVVTLEVFYPAEDYHQDYFARNPDNRYCALVVAPKVEKFEQVFRDVLRPRER